MQSMPDRRSSNLVYICTPVHNAVGTIDTTIMSIISQEGDFFLHYHIQDCCSTDGTVAKIKKWKSLIRQLPIRCRDIIFTYESEPDNGMYDAIVRSIKYMNVPSDAIVSYINADDFLFQGTLATVCRMFTDIGDSRWIRGAVYTINHDSSHRSHRASPLYDIFSVCGTDEIANGLCDGIHLPFIQQEGSFWKHTLWERVGGVNKDLKLAGDWDLWRRFAAHCDSLLAPYAFGVFRFSHSRLSKDLDPYWMEMNAILSVEKRRRQAQSILVQRPGNCKIIHFNAENGRYGYSCHEIKREGKEKYRGMTQTFADKEQSNGGIEISIVTPSFNQASFLPRMLASIERQTLLPHEHLIFDAGSTDGSLDILEQYCRSAKFAALRVEQDRGPVDAINKGLAAASGDVLAWLNTDDGYVSDDILETVSRLFENHPDVDIVYGCARLVSADSDETRPAWIQGDADNLKNALAYSVGIAQPAVFFRRTVYERIGSLDPAFSYCFDYEYWIRMAMAGLKFMFIDKECAYATLHDASISGSIRVAQLEQSVEAVKKYFSFVSSEWIEKLVLRKHHDLDSYFQPGNDESIKNSTPFLNVTDDIFRYHNRSDEAVRAIVLSEHGSLAGNTRKQLRRCGLFNSKRVVVTSFDRAFFDSGMTLIAGLHRYQQTRIPIFIYDGGLTSGQREKLSRFSNVFIVAPPEWVASCFDDHPKMKPYALKSSAVHDVSNYLEAGDLVLWCDAGVAPLRPLDTIFDLLSKEEVFFIDHDDKEVWPIYNIMFTHPQALERLSATTEEMLADHARASLMGYKIGGRFQPLFDEAYAYSQDIRIMCWDKHPSQEDDAVASRPSLPPSREKVAELHSRAKGDPAKGAFAALARHFPYHGHRHDQSIYSILVTRHDVKLHSASHFCRSTDHSSQASKISWHGGCVEAKCDFLQGMDTSTMCYHHRRTYTNHDGLDFDCRASEALVVLGNGPSLRGFDFDRLEGFDTMGMNAAYRYWERIGWSPRYYICLDTVVGLSHKEAIARLIRESDVNGIRYFVLRRNLVDCLEDLADHPRILVFDDMQKSFSLLSGELITTGSHAALMGAIFGYRTIYLLGIDCNYTERVSGSREIGEHVLEIVDGSADNPNYFFDDYQRQGDRYHVPNPGANHDSHLLSWRMVGSRLECTGITVLNTNRMSRLDAFPFCDFEDVERVLKGPYRRSERAHIDEAELVARLFAGRPVAPVMVDVGAHHGWSAHRFLTRGWKIVAFEPDAANRRHLQDNFGSHPMMTIDPRAIADEPAEAQPFFTSDRSTGISSLRAFHDTHRQTATVPVTSLRNVVEEYELPGIDFLKIDTEGYDLPVLKGLPWDNIQPRAILCEFEDRKTKLLGYSFHDMAAFLRGKGYAVFVSEWHPVARYGIRHDWRRLVPYPCQLQDSAAWGNLIAFRDAPGNDTLRAVAEEIVELDRAAAIPISPPLALPPPAEPAAAPKPGAPVRPAAARPRADVCPADVCPVEVEMKRPGLAVRLAAIARNRHTRLFVMKRLASPTAAGLFGGLALVGAGIAGGVGSVWLVAAGLASVGLVVMKEAVLWRWRCEQDRAQAVAEQDTAARALSEAVATERARSQEALAKALATERDAAARALSEAVATERARSQEALAKALATERDAAARALSEAVATERGRVEAVLERALVTERNARSLVDVQLADRRLPLKRTLLLFTIPRSGSTWLFDMLHTHPAVRMEPTARVWLALGMDGKRYPAAFYHADGASLPVETSPGKAAAIPIFPPAAMPEADRIEEAERWALEKGHPQFVGFEAGRLAARIRDLRESGVEVEVVYGVRCPLDAMRSMAAYKRHDPEWLKHLPVAEIPQYVARSLETLLQLQSLFGGFVIEYESLPDSAALARLACRLAPAWGEAEAKTWLAHAASVTERSRRAQRPGAGFLVTSHDQADPDEAWCDAAADIATARDAHRRLVTAKHPRPPGSAGVPPASGP